MGIIYEQHETKKEMCNARSIPSFHIEISTDDVQQKQIAKGKKSVFYTHGACSNIE